MPFDREFDAVHSAIISACDSPDLLLSCSRADDFYGAGHIMEDVLRGIVRSEYILADLTGKNPNVFYELGIAHSCKEPSNVIMITRNIDDVPFDLRHLRYIVYRSDDAGLRKLGHDLTRAVRSDSPDSFRFAVTQNGTYHFDERLSGQHGNLYSFRFLELWIGISDAKLTIQVYRHSLDEGSRWLDPDHNYIEVGHTRPIQPTKWSLRLDRVQNKHAYFSVVRTSNVD
jgi:hypothetical protein